MDPDTLTKEPYMPCNLAYQISNEVTEELGTVMAVDGDVIVVRSAAGVYRARRAASCLLDANVGDLVLLATADQGASYVLAVLERATNGHASLSLEGDVSLRVTKGRLALTADEGLGLASGADVTVASKSVRVDAVEGDVCLQRLGFFSRVVDAQMERITYLAGSVDATIDRLAQRLKRFYRRVDEIEHARMGQLDCQAESTIRLRGRHAVIDGVNLVKLHGDQIHLG